MAATSFATPEDLTQSWRSLTSDEANRATMLLRFASAMIRVECPGIDAKITTVPPATAPELDPDIPRMVACAMVKRAMIVGTEAEGVNAEQQTAGPFAKSLTFSNPMGNLYLTKAEKRLLGCGAQTAFTVPMGGVSTAVHAPWCSLAFGATYCSCGADIAGRPIYEVG
ncbi:phage Gp19/Gp15/Gp42 family protein [Cellulomonas sp. ACRRI]|uniref:Gp19/Gp15/Gp42 family protein n=1 Tax=Cellulomonas sp. ACRRI TaxID=2918188 RepID=UPI001EF36464|nr:Gp19/Gp15/Gp42 family protein [Cellulomonas sp. ACRRI]MCG7284967.1 phage Gp19/Gp15/Gp42 family protein [Cellulomonas sp. ACRRI]